MHIKRQWIILLIALLSAACVPQVAQTATLVPPTVMVSTEAPRIPTATPDCQHANGVTLEIRRVSDSEVSLHISGLKSGEKPYITYNTSTNGVGAIRIESGNFVKGADAHGEFSTEDGGLIPLNGQTSATWDIRVIHSRGVECATITLP